MRMALERSELAAWLLEVGFGNPMDTYLTCEKFSLYLQAMLDTAGQLEDTAK